MKIKYITNTGEIIRHGIESDLVADSIHSILEVQSFPSIPYWGLSVVNGEVVQKSAGEITKLTTAHNFNPALAIKRMGEVYTVAQQVALTPYFSILQSYMVAKNFAGLKLYANQLLTDTKVTQGEYNAFIGILEEQSLSLEDF
jgi:hypothetical protein